MGELHELIKIDINNARHYVSIHGNDASNPILLMLHGGPGMAQIGFIRYFTKPLEDHFMVINYDQRGAGKSYSSDIKNSSMTIAQLVDDAQELVKYIQNRFDGQKIFLCGHSWGTVVAIELLKQNPQLFEAYISVSQVVNMQLGEEISYQYTIDKATIANNDKAIKELKLLGKPPYASIKDNIIQRKWLDTFGGSTYSIKMNKIMQKASSTAEYNIWDWLWKFRKGMMFSLNCLKDELMLIAFDEENIELKTSVYFFSGNTDYQVPFELVEKFYTQIKAPHKELVIFKNCGHMIPFELPEQFCNELIKIKNKTK